MPSLPKSKIALTRLSPCWERGASLLLPELQQSAIFAEPRWMGRWGQSLTLCLLHKDAAVWGQPRGEAAAPTSWQLQGRCLVPASLQETPSAPKSHPRVCESKLQDPKQKGCGQVGEVGCWSVF